MSSRTPRVAVLKGGFSAEREVSLASGRECAQGLRDAGYQVEEIDVGRDIARRLTDSAPDVAFNALHGRWGEDGCIQGVLEILKIPYTHSGVLASALAMDKQRAKQAFAAAGLPVAAGRLVPRDEVAAGHPMTPPYVVKPYNEGSSVGVHIVRERSNGPAPIGPDAPATLLVEAYAPGRELTVAVMGDRPLTVTDILAEGWYDYHAKYAAGGSRHICPADVPAAVFEACLDHARRAHDAVGARGVSRTDFRWDEAKGVDGLVILEINTQPGMTPTSLTPEQAAAVGIGFADLCRWIVEDASCDR